MENKDYSYQCNYCISRLICICRGKKEKCLLADNEEYFKQLLGCYGKNTDWDMVLESIAAIQPCFR